VQPRHAELRLVAEKRIRRARPIVQLREMLVETLGRGPTAAELREEPGGVERHHPRVLRRIALREALAAEQVEARLEGARGVAWLEVAGGGVVEMPPSAGP